MDNIIEIFFALIIGHALADFVLQSDVMAKGKNRHNPAIEGMPHWAYWLTSHALMHGGVVWIITGIAWLGIYETITHWLIDFMKCEKRINIHQDQTIHFITKILIVILIQVSYIYG